jgi:hypothetical protein
VDFDEALARLGFRASSERTPRDVRTFVAHPNPYLTYTVQAFDDGTALCTWEFAVGEYLATKGIQFGSDETLNQFAFPREDERGPQEAEWLAGCLKRAEAQLASVRFDDPQPSSGTTS